MMRAKRFLLLAFLIFGICCGFSAKTLVAYDSFTNNVRTIVNELATQKEVDILEIQPAEEELDYAANNYALGTQLLNAIKAAPNDADSYPAIKAVSVDLSEYDDVIVATPLWWSQMAAPMQTFLFNYGAQMAGKRVSLLYFYECIQLCWLIVFLIPLREFAQPFTKRNLRCESEIPLQGSGISIGRRHIPRLHRNQLLVSLEVEVRRQYPGTNQLFLEDVHKGQADFLADRLRCYTLHRVEWADRLLRSSSPVLSASHEKNLPRYHPHT